MKQAISLVLSSGGARGLAHIGVIEELERQGFEIKSIAGTSMGALVGGVYATGKMEEYKNWLSGLDKLDVFKMIDFTLSTQGLVKGDKIFKVMKKMVPDINIEDLSIPYVAVAADIINHKRLTQCDKRLTNQNRQFLKSFSQNDKKLNILQNQFKKNFGLRVESLGESKKVNAANIENMQGIRAQQQQRINLEEFRLQKSLDNNKYLQARTILKDAIANGKDEDQMLEVVDLMVQQNMLDNDNATVLKRVLHEPTKWERFKAWIFGK